MNIRGVGGGGGHAYQAIQQAAQARRSERLKAAAAPKFDGPKETGSVARALDQAVQQVSHFDRTSDKMVIDLATGRDTNIHNTMIELEKADIALKYTVQLRNRALSAYEELMRIQV
jgi:flagellar hook-basal body complex protein FliE